MFTLPPEVRYQIWDLTVVYVSLAKLTCRAWYRDLRDTGLEAASTIEYVYGHGDVRLFEWLRSTGHKPSHKDILIACREDNVDILHYLASGGFLDESRRMQMIYAAISSGRGRCFEFLWRVGEKVAGRAAYWGNISVLSKCVTGDESYNYFTTLLHEAIVGDRLEIVHWLQQRYSYESNITHARNLVKYERADMILHWSYTTDYFKELIVEYSAHLQREDMLMQFPLDWFPPEALKIWVEAGGELELAQRLLSVSPDSSLKLWKLIPTMTENIDWPKVKWLAEHGVPWGANACLVATKYLELQDMMRIYHMGAPWNAEAYLPAIETNNMHIIRWTWSVVPEEADWNTCLAAAMKYRIKIFKWLYSMCPNPNADQVALEAASIGRVRILNYLVERGHQLPSQCYNHRPIDKAATMRLIKCLAFHKVPLPDGFYEAHIMRGHKGLLIFLSKHVAPITRDVLRHFKRTSKHDNWHRHRKNFIKFLIGTIDTA